MAFVLPEAAVEVPAAVEAAPALLAFVSRFGLLAGVADQLVGLLFRNNPSEPSLQNAMRPIVNLLAYPARAINVTLIYVGFALHHTQSAMARTNARLGSAYNSSLKFARKWDAELRAALTARINFVNNRVGQAYNAAIAHARIWDAELRDALTAKIDFVNARVGQAYNAALAHARIWDAQLRTQLQAEITHVNDRVGQAYNAALQHARVWDAESAAATQATITHQVVAPTRAEWPILVGELSAATAAAGPELVGLRSLIAAVPTTAPTTLAGAAADPLAITRVLTRAMTDCTIPNCRNLSKYGRDLHGLGELLGAGGLLAFLAWAATHPGEAARDTENVAGGIVRTVAHETERLLTVL